MNNPVLFSLVVQLAVVLPAAGILAVFSGVSAYSYLLGAAIHVVPNAYFTLYAFRYRFSGADDKAARWIARSFQQGEFGKLALAGVGFALVFRLVSPLNIPALFTGFCSMLVCQWFIAADIARRTRVPHVPRLGMPRVQSGAGKMNNRFISKV